MSEPKTYTGGCHCKKVRYEVTTDLGRVIQCNCSHCSIKSLLLTFVPPEQFKLLSGDDATTTYHFNRHAIDHRFCATCGVQSFAQGKNRDGTPMYAINVRCLEGVDVASLTLTPADGKRY
jgi:hypothetical protein